MNEIKPIGECGVDSGQLLVVDPQIFVGNWAEEEFKDERNFVHTETGSPLNYKEHFKNFAEVLQPYDKDMNAMIETGEVAQLPRTPSTHSLSYNSCCAATLDTDCAVLGNDLAFATRVGLGDGCYEAFLLGDKIGLEVVFLEEYDLSLAQNVGEIKCESGTIAVFDPCYAGSQKGLEAGALALEMRYVREDGTRQLNYDIGSAGLGIIASLPKGVYEVFMDYKEYFDEDGESWGKRVHGIAIVKKED
jgi:hypothetical protein